MINRKMNERRPTFYWRSVLLVLALGLVTGCGSMRETFPKRSATEQLLMSTALDRALENLDGKPYAGKKVFVTTTRLGGYDPKYVDLSVRRKLLATGARLVDCAEKSELTVEVSTGALSVDHRTGLIGLPSIPIPIPFASTPLSTPELALFKDVKLSGVAKVILTCYNTLTGEQIAYVPTLRGVAVIHERWYLLIGPFRSSNIHEEFEDR